MSRLLRWHLKCVYFKKKLVILFWNYKFNLYKEKCDERCSVVPFMAYLPGPPRNPDIISCKKLDCFGAVMPKYSCPK